MADGGGITARDDLTIKLEPPPEEEAEEPEPEPERSVVTLTHYAFPGHQKTVCGLQRMTGVYSILPADAIKLLEKEENSDVCPGCIRGLREALRDL